MIDRLVLRTHLFNNRRQCTFVNLRLLSALLVSDTLEDKYLQQAVMLLLYALIVKMMRLHPSDSPQCIRFVRPGEIVHSRDRR